MEITIHNAKKVLKKYLTENRKKLYHSIRVAKVAKILAEKNGVPVDEAVIASLFKATVKDLSNQILLSFCCKKISLY